MRFDPRPVQFAVGPSHCVPDQPHRPQPRCRTLTARSAARTYPPCCGEADRTSRRARTVTSECEQRIAAPSRHVGALVRTASAICSVPTRNKCRAPAGAANLRASQSPASGFSAALRSSFISPPNKIVGGRATSRRSVLHCRTSRGHNRQTRRGAAAVRGRPEQPKRIDSQAPASRSDSIMSIDGIVTGTAAPLEAPRRSTSNSPVIKRVASSIRQTLAVCPPNQTNHAPDTGVLRRSGNGSARPRPLSISMQDFDRVSAPDHAPDTHDQR